MKEPPKPEEPTKTETSEEEEESSQDISSHNEEINEQDILPDADSESADSDEMAEIITKCHE